MMHPRTFACALLAGAFALLGATMATNFALDPQYVFGTPLTRDDENANYRYHRVRQYQAQRDRVDGLLFASSRGKAFDPALVAQKSGAERVAKFDVTAGMITDHLPALEYVLRDKAERGEKLRAVLLLIDVDSFGKPPSTNVNIDSFLSPELSGEHPARFWWRYLTVFQFRMWRGIVAHRMRGSERTAIEPKSLRFDMRRLTMAGFGPPASDIPAPRVLHAANDVPWARLLVATRPNLAAHLGMVARFVALCRTNGIQLTVATTPMRADAASLYDPADLRDVVERLSRIVPVWDFTAPQWLAADIAYWDDRSHFKPIVGEMMLQRMFGSNIPGDFGVLRGAKAQPAAALRARPQT
jgi:hypothetical protein